LGEDKKRCLTFPLKHPKGEFKMKKIFSIIFSAIIIFTIAASVFAIAIIDEDGNIQENEILPGGIMTTSIDFRAPNFMYETGEVVEFRQNGQLMRIRKNQYSYFDFVIDANTFTLGYTPQIGDTVRGFYDATLPATMIYPPQHTAVVIVKYDGNRVIVDRFDENWISSAYQYRLNLNEETQIYFQGGDRFTGEISELIGRKLVVEFSISHRDIPETIPNPQRVTILYERAVHPTINIGENYPNIWQNIQWHGYDVSENIDWGAYDIIITLNGKSRGVPNARHAKVGETMFPNYVPLRAITEMLGFAPMWNAENREVSLSSPRGEIKLSIGSPNYTVVNYSYNRNGTTAVYTLEPPVIINDLTYVPVKFFREVFGFNNAWWADGNIALDNSERME
jgi:hypothetical protein